MAKTNKNNKPKGNKKKGRKSGNKKNKLPQHVRKRNNRLNKIAEKYGAELVAKGELEAGSSFRLQEGHTVVAHLPFLFCLQDNMHLIAAVSSATSLSFGQELYCLCRDAASAVRVAADYSKKNSKKSKFQNNKIIKASRFGPSFCAFVTPHTPNAKILTLVNLDPRTTCENLFRLFPHAVDVDVKKTCAKVAFGSAAQCRQAYEGGGLVWPYGAPAKALIPDTEEEEQAAEKDTKLHKFPGTLVNNPCVVFLKLQHKFDFRADMKLLQALPMAEKFYFPPSFAAVFPVRSAARQAKEALCRHTMDGRRLDCYIHFGQDSNANTAGPNKEEDETTLKEEGKSDEEEDLEGDAENQMDNLDSSSGESSDDEGAAVPKRLL